MNHFDADGNIKNPLFTMDGQPVQGNPRWDAYQKSQAAQEQLKEFIGDLFEKDGWKWGNLGKIGAAAAGVTIQLRPEALKETGQKLKQHAREFHTELPTATSTIRHLVESSRSRSLQPIVERMIADLTAFNRWYDASTNEIADFINKKADAFIQADKG